MSWSIPEEWINDAIVIVLTLLLALVARGLLARAIRRSARTGIPHARGRPPRAPPGAPPARGTAGGGGAGRPHPAPPVDRDRSVRRSRSTR